MKKICLVAVMSTFVNAPVYADSELFIDESRLEVFDFNRFEWDDPDIWSNGVPTTSCDVVLRTQLVGNQEVNRVCVDLNLPVTIARLEMEYGTELTGFGQNLFVSGDTDTGFGFLACRANFRLGNLVAYNAATKTLNSGGFLVSEFGNGLPGILEFRGADIQINKATWNLFGVNVFVRDQNTGLDAFRNLSENPGFLGLDDGFVLNIPGNFKNSGGIKMNINPSIRVPQLNVGGGLINDGTITLCGNTAFSVAGSYSGSGTITTFGTNNQISVIGAYVQNGGELKVRDGDTIHLSDDLELNNARLEMEGDGSLIKIDGDLRNDGSLIIVRGDGIEIEVAGDILQTGGKVDTGPSGVDSFVLKARTMVYQNNACISGEGKLITAVVHVNNSFLTPGNTPGKLVIDGDLTITGTSDTEIELGGTVQGDSYDWIQQSGGANGITLGGTLTVKLVDNFDCHLLSSDEFIVATSDLNISGSFTNAASNSRIATADGLGTFLVTYGLGSSSPKSVTLSDFQANSVAPRSFAAWLIDQGLAPDTLPGIDSNGNGKSNLEEYYFGTPWGEPAVSKFEITNDGQFIWTFGIPKSVTGVYASSLSTIDFFESGGGPVVEPAGSTASKNLFKIQAFVGPDSGFYYLRLELDE